jgi:hypothetical protein
MKYIFKKIIKYFLLKIFKANPDSFLYLAYYLLNIRPGHDLELNGELNFLKKLRFGTVWYLVRKQFERITVD